MSQPATETDIASAAMMLPFERSTARAMDAMKQVVSAIRCSLVAGVALGAGLMVQSILMAVVLAFTFPSTLRFLDSTVTLYFAPTAFMLLLFGTPFICIRKNRVQLPWTGGAVIGALLGALGASIPEIYACTNPHIHCFLVTSRDTVAGAGLILSGAACGAAVFFVYRRLAPTKKTRATDPETV